MNNSQVAAIAAADLPDARRLMWALGHQSETGNSFSVEMSDGATVTYFYHSWHNLLPATLPSGVAWEDYGLTEARAQEVLAAIVQQQGETIEGEPIERVVATASAIGTAPEWHEGGTWMQGQDAAYAEHVWTSTIDHNVWAPGVEGWVIKSSPGDIPPWIQPGSTNAYPIGAVVAWEDRKRRSNHPANVWSPNVAPSLWDDLGAIGGGGGLAPWAAGTYQLDAEVVYEPDNTEWRNRRADNNEAFAPPVSGSGWMQIGPGVGPFPWKHVGNEGYPAGWQVTHNGRLWSNPSAGTFWEPGVAVWVDEGPA